jgi:hypothetical protein
MKSFFPTDRSSIFLLIAVLCCVLEGAARKWLVGDVSVAGRLAYFSKDVAFVAIALFGICTVTRSSLLSKPFIVAGLGLTSLGAMTSSISGISLVGGILSARSFLVLPLAAWVVGQSLPRDSLKKAALWISLISIPVAGLGAVQFFSPAGSVLNRYSTEGEYVAMTGFDKRVRATGTFSYITGFSNFGNLAVWAGIASLTLARTPTERLIGMAGTVAGFGCTFETVSRAAALISLGIVVTWAVLGGGVIAKMKNGVLFAILVTVGFLLTGWGDDAIEIASAVQTRSEHATDNLSSRFDYTFIMPLNALYVAPLGGGFGFQQAGRQVLEDLNRLKSSYESAWGRVIMETGIFGLVGVIMTFGAVIKPSWVLYCETADPTTRTVVAVTAATALCFAIVGIHFNHVASFMFWFLAALLLSFDNPTRTAVAPLQAGRSQYLFR